jgi:hypothetical protein
MTDAMMTDAETRGLILRRLYELHSKSEWVDWDNFHDLGLPQQEVGRYLKQLHDLGLAEGKFVASTEYDGYADVQVRIRARGAEAVEDPEKRPSDVKIDQSINAQVGNQLDIDKLSAAIDHLPGTLEEKGDAKSLLKQLSENKLLMSVLALAFPNRPTS